MPQVQRALTWPKNPSAHRVAALSTRAHARLHATHARPARAAAPAHAAAPRSTHLDGRELGHRVPHVQRAARQQPLPVPAQRVVAHVLVLPQRAARVRGRKQELLRGRRGGRRGRRRGGGAGVKARWCIAKRRFQSTCAVRARPRAHEAGSCCNAHKTLRGQCWWPLLRLNQTRARVRGPPPSSDLPAHLRVDEEARGRHVVALKVAGQALQHLGGLVVPGMECH